VNNDVKLLMLRKLSVFYTPIFGWAPTEKYRCSSFRIISPFKQLWHGFWLLY